MTWRLTLGFVPLSDAAPLIVAQAHGLFAAQGLDVELSREVSWATIRDKVAVGALQGAQMLAPMAIAATLGAGSEPAPIVAPLALAQGGAAVTLSTRLAGGCGADGLARLVSRRREEGASPFTFAAVFPYSIHNLLLRSWLAGAGIDPNADVRLITAPPSRMADLLAEGVIDGFAAGEPWGGLAEAAGVGRVIVRAADLWKRAPDKVFGVAEAWAEREPDVLTAVLRALLAAAAWCDEPANREALAALLARPEHVDAPAQVIARGLAHVTFRRGAASAPRIPDAAWLVEQMARWRLIVPFTEPEAVAARVYRPELYAAALTP